MTPTAQPSFYARHSALSDPGEHQTLLDNLPADVAGLCRVVQSLMIHDHFGLHLYGPPPADFHLAFRRTLPVSERIDAILAQRHQPISSPRPPFGRSVGTCRDFALLLCAMLRHRAVPARLRCGFAKYFHPPSYEDHWICEYWNPERRGWAMADAQLDEAHRARLSIAFDPAEIPRGQFVPAWQAWRSCRTEAADSAQFSHGDTKGAWFMQVNLARDLLALSKREVSPWDSWREAAVRNRTLDRDAVAGCDRIAEMAELAEVSDDGPEPSGAGAASLPDFLLRPPWQG